MLAALFYVAPVYVMIINGLKDKSYMTLSDMWKLPHDLSGGGFGYAWDALRPYLLNSLQMAIPATIGSSLLGAVNGYLSRSGSSAGRTSSSRWCSSACSSPTRASWCR